MRDYLFEVEALGSKSAGDAQNMEADQPGLSCGVYESRAAADAVASVLVQVVPVESRNVGDDAIARRHRG